jgi:hypothetical protein
MCGEGRRAILLGVNSRKRRNTMKRKITATVAVLATGLAVAAAPAAAKQKPVKYSGTTSGGAPITFKLAQGKMKGLLTSVFVSCSTGPSSSVKGGVETVEVGAAKVGPEVKITASDYTPLAWQDVTKTYTVQASRSGKRISGKLGVSFSYFIPDLYYPRTYFCFGSADFSAKAK